MRKTKFAVNPGLCALALITWLLLTAVAVAILPLGRIVSAAVFFVLGLIFLAVAVGNGITIEVQTDGLRRSLLGRQISFLPWEKVREVGVCGTRPFHNAGAKKVGTLYIYFSEQKLDDRQRFDMVLRWPPRDKYYMVYDMDRLRTVQLRWGGKITTYNSGSFHFS